MCDAKWSCVIFSNNDYETLPLVLSSVSLRNCKRLQAILLITDWGNSLFPSFLLTSIQHLFYSLLYVFEVSIDSFTSTDNSVGWWLYVIYFSRGNVCLTDKIIVRFWYVLSRSCCARVHIHTRTCSTCKRLDHFSLGNITLTGDVVRCCITDVYICAGRFTTIIMQKYAEECAEKEDAE